MTSSSTPGSAGTSGASTSGPVGSATEPSLADQKAAVVARIKLQRRRLQTQAALEVVRRENERVEAAADKAASKAAGSIFGAGKADGVGVISALFDPRHRWTIARVAELVRRYPVAAAGVAGLAFAIGPGRVFRWATMLAPFLMRTPR